MSDVFFGVVLAAAFLRLVDAVLRTAWYRAKWGSQRYRQHKAFGRYLEGSAAPWWLSLLETIISP